MARDRDEGHPIIIAGGPCAYNPEPLADFIDLFAIGDGEYLIGELIDLALGLLRGSGCPGRGFSWKRPGGSRESMFLPSTMSIITPMDGWRG